MLKWLHKFSQILICKCISNTLVRRKGSTSPQWKQTADILKLFNDLSYLMTGLTSVITTVNLDIVIAHMHMVLIDEQNKIIANINEFYSGNASGT